MKYIKSRITVSLLFVSILMLIFPFPVILICLFKILMDFTFCFKYILWSIIFFSMLLLTLYTFKDIKYIIIKNDELTYYSFLMIFGKTLNFRNYIGKIIVMETMCATSYEIVYLVDGQNRTALKIASVYYENFEEINDAIPLKKIRFSPNRRQYLKLLFIGKIKVEKKNKGYRRKIKTRNKKTTKI